MKPYILLQKKISYPTPEDTTAVAELRVIDHENIDKAIFVCRYIPISSVQEAHCEFYNVAYADQIHTVPTEPETLNRVCFVRKDSVLYYAENSAKAQKWCDEVYREVQRLLQSYNVNFPLGNCDRASITCDDICVAPATPLEDGKDVHQAAGTIYLAEEDTEGMLRIPDGMYPVALEYNDILYKIKDMEHDVPNSVFIVDTTPVKVSADIGQSVVNWKVWCAFSGSEELEGGIGLSACDATGSLGTVINVAESDDGYLKIPDTNYPVGIEHNGRIYNINEVMHDDDNDVFLVNTQEVRVISDFAGVKTYWRVWCMKKNKPACGLSGNKDDSSVSGMIW
jgi:hypothetical protein